MSLVTLAPYGGAQAAGTLTWDPSNKASSITLSGGNLTAAGGGSNTFVLGTKKLSGRGKRWFSVTVGGSSGDYVYVGFFPTSQAVGSYLFTGSQRDNSYSAYPPAYSQSETVSSTAVQKYHGGSNPYIATAMAFGGVGIEVRAELDLTAGTVTFYRRQQSTGLWYAEGGGAAFTGLSGDFYPVLAWVTTGRTFTANMKCLADVAADFIADYTFAFPGQTVSFYDQSSGDITSWYWDFGDGNTSTSQNPTHAYASAGTYTVTLSVTSPIGGNTFVASNYITVSGTVTLDAAPGGFGNSLVWIANLAPTYTPTLSGGNLTFTGKASAWTSAYATRNAWRSSGVCSFVVTSTGAGTTLMAGVAQIKHDMTLSYAGSDGFGWCNYAASGQSYHNGAAVACTSAWNTTKLKIEVNFNTGTLTFYRWNGSSWVAGSNPYTGITGPVIPCVSAFGTTSVGVCDLSGW